MKTKILQKTFLSLTALTLVCFALSPQARAVCQEGCDIVNGSTFLGESALLNNTGFANTAIGFNALFSNTTGNANTASGTSALVANRTGNQNTAMGGGALFWNTEGSNNTATGYYAMVGTGSYVCYENTATGASALHGITTGSYNTATGFEALTSNTEGSSNTATGWGALTQNTTGNNNVADGVQALVSNTTGPNNTAIGRDALLRNTTGSSNIAVGYFAGSNLTTGSNNIDIGNTGNAGESNTIRIGKRGVQNTTVIAGIRGTTISGGIAVMIDANGRLGTTTSSARFKEAIKPMDNASEAILALKPVTFRYKHELDPDGIPQFGLVAEDVEKINPNLVARNDDGKPYTVRYEAVNAMLLNEFQKEHRMVEEQQATIAQLKAADAKQEEKISALTELVKAQAAQIQKVSAQLELNRPTPRIVVENR
jgi:Chaperone of endosialidase